MRPVSRSLLGRNRLAIKVEIKKQTAYNSRSARRLQLFFPFEDVFSERFDFSRIQKPVAYRFDPRPFTAQVGGVNVSQLLALRREDQPIRLPDGDELFGRLENSIENEERSMVVFATLWRAFSKGHTLS